MKNINNRIKEIEGLIDTTKNEYSTLYEIRLISEYEDLKDELIDIEKSENYEI